MVKKSSKKPVRKTGKKPSKKKLPNKSVKKSAKKAPGKRAEKVRKKVVKKVDKKLSRKRINRSVPVYRTQGNSPPVPRVVTPETEVITPAIDQIAQESILNTEENPQPEKVE